MMRDIEGDENMRLWQEAMAAIKAGNAEAAEAVADRMPIKSDARLVRAKAKAIRHRVNSPTQHNTGEAK